MIINMTTIRIRKEHYIDRTLESLFQSDGRDIPVNLILGSSDTSHVERYRNVANIVAWDQEAESQAREGHLRHNCNVNAIRALAYGGDDYCLCCEDDIIFDPNWLSQLMLTVAEIEGKEYVLNLGQQSDQPSDKRYATHTQLYLCGAQAIFYPSKALRSAVAEYLQQNITKGMNDDLVGRYAKKYAALYNTTPVLVRHIGQVSSFDEPSPPVKQSREERRTENAANVVPKTTMPINMTTFGGRKLHYIYETLQSLFASDWAETNSPINLIMGSEDQSHLGEYAAHPFVRIVPWDVETHPQLRLNCTLNKIRALRWGDDEATLICEDDILFHRNWFASLQRATAEMGTEDYVLSLFAAKPNLEGARLVKGKQWVKRYPTFILQGAQALFYPAKAIRDKVADYLMGNITLASGDELIGRYARTYAALYATKEVLVEHIGGVSCFQGEGGVA